MTAVQLIERIKGYWAGDVESAKGDIDTALRKAYLRGRLEQLNLCHEHKDLERRGHELRAWNQALDRAAEWIDQRMARSPIGDELKKQLKIEALK